MERKNLGLDTFKVSNEARQFIREHCSPQRNMEPNRLGIMDIMEAKVFDKNHRLKDSRKVVDIITNTGLAEIAGLILSDVTGVTAFDVIGIGTGDAAAQATNTGLESEIKRKSGAGSRVTTTTTNDTAQLVSTFSSADGLSGTATVKEACVANMTTTGITVARQVFTGLAVDWDAGDSIEITEKIVCSGA